MCWCIGRNTTTRETADVGHGPGFPVLVLGRPPLVLRDLELLKEIKQPAPSVVFFSMISAPDSPTYERVRQMDLWPGPPHRPQGESAMPRWSRLRKQAS